MKKYILTLLFSVISALAFCALDYSGQDLTGKNFSSEDLTGADFTNANLTSANFRYADVYRANFTNADLTLAGFENATVNGADFTNANLTLADFRYAKGLTIEQLRSAASIENVSLGGLDMTNWDFSNLDLTSVNFTCSTISGANFTNADLTSACLWITKGLTIKQLRSAASIKKVRLHELDMTNWDFSNLDLTSADFWSANVSGANFTNANLTSANFNNANVSRTNFTNADLTSVSFGDANVSGVNFTNADLTLASLDSAKGLTIEQLRSAASIEYVNLSRLDMTNWDFSNLDLTSVKFTDSTISGANFTNADLTSAGFENATVNGANFTNANLTSAGFENATVNGANFTNANLASADFGGTTVSGADFTNANLTSAHLYGAKGLIIEQLRSAASIKKVNLYGRDMTNWDFSNLDLTSVGFGSANVSGANFTNANLISANFNNANVSRTNFTNANLRSAFFNDADLTDANFEGADLTNANFLGATNFTIPQNAIFNYTVMPDGSIRTDSVIIETSLPTSLILFENTKHNLEVSAREKDGKKLTYTWYVDKNNGKGFVKAGTKSTLAITPKANMVGWQYYCAVSNGSETRNTSVSKITAVRTPVKITSKPKALNTFEGAENAGFSVSATGYDVKYQWQVYKVVGYNAKGKPIYDWVDIAGATSANYKPESDFENNGLKYRCKVYNDGSAAYTSGVKLTVNEAAKIGGITIYQKPETAKQAHLVASEENAAEYFDITLTANASGYKVKYQWYLNGEKIEKATGKTLSIKKPQIGEYAYSCKVYNEASKNVVATEDMASFVLVISALKLPIDLMGQTLYFEDENGSLESNFYFAATSKSSCILINPNTYDEDWFDEGDKWGDEFKINFYDSSSYSYKRNNDENASLKLTFTKNVYLTKNYYDDYDESYESEKIKLSSVKTVLQGTLSAFDENGYAVFKTNDGKIYNVRRVSNGAPLPESISGKVFMGFFYAKDKKNSYLVDYDYDEDKYIINENFGKGTYTYKKISSNVVKYTLNFAKGKCDGYVIGTNDRYFYRKTGTENKKPIFSVGQGFSDSPLTSDFR